MSQKTRIRYSPNGLTICGRITAQGVLASPMLLISKKIGSVRAVAGTMIVPRIRLNNQPRPANSNFEKAYPAIAADMVASAALEKE